MEKWCFVKGPLTTEVDYFRLEVRETSGATVDDIRCPYKRCAVYGRVNSKDVED